MTEIEKRNTGRTSDGRIPGKDVRLVRPGEHWCERLGAEVDAARDGDTLLLSTGPMIYAARTLAACAGKRLAIGIHGLRDEMFDATGSPPYRFAVGLAVGHASPRRSGSEPEVGTIIRAFGDPAKGEDQYLVWFSDKQQAFWWRRHEVVPEGLDVDVESADGARPRETPGTSDADRDAIPSSRVDYDLDGGITIGGHRVPNLRAVRRGDSGQHVFLTLDGRFAFDAPRREIDRWLWFVANAMAVAAGFSSFGPNSVPLNPYKVWPSHAPGS